MDFSLRCLKPSKRVSLMSKNVLITGSASGIGLALVRNYLSKGDSVFAVARKVTDELTATEATSIDGVDVAIPSSLSKITEAINDQPIDILINCAGILSNETLDDLDYDRIEAQWQVNALGPLRVTETVLPNLASGSKIAMITSRMGSIEDNTSGSRYGYRVSKAALNAISKSLSIDLKPKGIAVAILHPGLVSTKMIQGQGDIPPEGAASRLVERINDLTLENTGTFWHSNGEILPW